MYKKSGFIAGKSNALSKLTLRNPLFLRVFAEGEGNDTGNNEPPVNFETLIANARKEEKDKLYPRIQKLEEENRGLTQSLNSALIERATAQKKVDELTAALETATSDKVKDLETQLANAQNELQQLKDSTPNEEDIRARITAEFEVKYYRDKKLSDGAGDILETFADEVTGSTKEEVDASFDKAVQKTLAVKKQLGLVDADGKPIEQKGGKTTKDTKGKDKGADDKGSTRPPVSNPQSSEDDGYDIDYIQNLDPRSEEYKEFRKKMGLK